METPLIYTVARLVSGGAAAIWIVALLLHFAFIGRPGRSTGDHLSDGELITAFVIPIAMLLAAIR